MVQAVLADRRNLIGGAVVGCGFIAADGDGAGVDRHTERQAHLGQISLLAVTSEQEGGAQFQSTTASPGRDAQLVAERGIVSRRQGFRNDRRGTDAASVLQSGFGGFRAGAAGHAIGPDRKVPTAIARRRETAQVWKAMAGKIQGEAVPLERDTVFRLPSYGSRRHGSA